MDLKKLTINEFDKAARHFEDNSPSVYNLCKKDYPDILAEIDKEAWHSVLDAGCGTGAVLELFSRKYPDMRIYNKTDIKTLCISCGMWLESFDYKWFFRMHVVCRKI